MISALEEWRELSSGACLGGAEEWSFARGKVAHTHTRKIKTQK